jgi:hypothetical protein
MHKQRRTAVLFGGASAVVSSLLFLPLFLQFSQAFYMQRISPKGTVHGGIPFDSSNMPLGD